MFNRRSPWKGIDESCWSKEPLPREVNTDLAAMLLSFDLLTCVKSPAALADNIKLLNIDSTFSSIGLSSLRCDQSSNNSI